MITSAGRTFLAQNELAAETLTVDDVSVWAEHHAGGMFVLADTLPSGRAIKLHDTWEDGRCVIVHEYDDDDSFDEDTDTVTEFATGREALDHFLARING